MDFAKSLLNLIERFSEKAGVTVFGDPAQAIYDFILENKRIEQKTEKNLLDLIKLEEKRLKGIWFFDIELKKNYRLKNEDLLEPMLKLRNLISGTLRKEDYKAAYDLLKDVKQCSNGKGDSLTKFQLYRKRIEVLTKASYSYQEKIKHKIRVGNLPIAITPWIGVVFFDFGEKKITEGTFKSLVEQKKTRYPNMYFFKNFNIEYAWELLLDVSSDKSGRFVDITELRKVLLNPPAEVCISQFGAEGDTISTIHAAKGLEADSVHFFLPPFSSEKEFAFTEEGRVLYVAATRASKELHVEVGKSTPSMSLDSGRAFRIMGGGRGQFEIGIENDFIPVSVIFSGSNLKSREAVFDLQENLIMNSGEFIYYRAHRERKQRQFQIFGEFGTGIKKMCYYVGDMSESFYWDIKKIGDKVVLGSCGLGQKINHICQYGIATGVAPFEDTSKYANIPINFQKTGFYVYPILRGLSMMKFKNYTQV